MQALRDGLRIVVVLVADACAEEGVFISHTALHHIALHVIREHKALRQRSTDMHTVQLRYGRGAAVSVPLSLSVSRYHSLSFSRRLRPSLPVGLSLSVPLLLARGRTAGQHRRDRAQEERDLAGRNTTSRDI